ncbi:MAG: hypothetical protein SchgKO_04840 [Schleiferiaceae bacterium]
MKRTAYIFICSALALLHMGAKEPDVEYDILEASEIVLEGYTNINTFRCNNKEIVKRDSSQTIIATPTDYGLDLEGVNFAISVDGFSCKIPGMEGDIDELLNAENFPYIEFDITHLQVPDGKNGTASARISIAGKERLGLIDFTLLSREPHIHMKGSTPLYLSEFELEAPKKMLGMVVVRDQFLIEFDLVLKLRKKQTVSE